MEREFSISRIKRSAYFNMKEAHVHTYYEIYYLLSGKRRFFVEQKIYIVNKGDIMTIKRGALHRSTYLLDKTHERIVVCFSKNFIQPFLDELGEEMLQKCFETPHMSIPISRREYVEKLLQQMEQEYVTQDKFSKMLLKNHLYELLIFLMRCQEYQTNFTEKLGAGDKTMEQAAKYICENYQRPLTLEDAARQANMNATYFSRKFKQITGFAFKEYLNNIRIKEAIALLLETDDSITEIALKCGYNDSNYFGDVFKKIKGVSPYQYRKNKEFL